MLAIIVISTLILSALAGAIVALIALVGGQERSALVWVAMVPGLPAFFDAGMIVLGLLEEYASISLSGVGVLYALAGMSALAGGVLALIAWLQRHRSGKPR